MVGNEEVEKTQTYEHPPQETTCVATLLNFVCSSGVISASPAILYATLPTVENIAKLKYDLLQALAVRTARIENPDLDGSVTLILTVDALNS